MIKCIVDSDENLDVLDSWNQMNLVLEEDQVEMETMPKHFDNVILIKDFTKLEAIDLKCWYLLIPMNDSFSVHKMEQLRKTLSVKSSQIVRMYPLWGDIQEDHAELEYWETVHNGNIVRFKNLLNRRATSVTDKTSIKCKIEVPVPKVKHVDVSSNRGNYLKYVSFLDLVYLDVTSNTQITSDLFSLNWDDERGFKRALLSELGMYLLFIGIPTLICINKESMGFSIVGKSYK